MWEGLEEQSLLCCEDPGSPPLLVRRHRAAKAVGGTLTPGQCGSRYPILQERFSAVSCLPAKGQVSTGHFLDCQKATHCPLELILGIELTRKNCTLISHGGSPGPLIRVP